MKNIDRKKIYCNPLNLPYRYQFHFTNGQPDSVVNREAADPSMILFKDKYYIFASMSLDVFVSDDLVNWTSCPLPKELPLYDYAPDIRVIGDYVYFSASRRDVVCDFYRTKDILNGPYEKIDGTFDFWDPNIFEDDDGRIYFYWGCSNYTPVWGVELDRTTLKPIGKRKTLVESDTVNRGFEKYEDDSDNAPYIEGAWMTKHDKKYYLQIACPGTEYRIYCDAVYVSDSPLGPFVLAENNPYSYHPGGFMPGAGHGSTMSDKNGNFYHAATMQISLNHIFERRIGLWRAGFDSDGEMFCSQRFGDWPLCIADNNDDIWVEPPFYLLSYKKKTTASSSASVHGAENATDENCKTFWKADSNKPGEFLIIDLGDNMCVDCVQINFADEKIPYTQKVLSSRIQEDRVIDDEHGKIRYLLEASRDNENYFMLTDKSNVDTDLPHDFVVFDKSIACRFVKLTILEVPYNVNPCISALRIFGNANKQKPRKSQFTAKKITDTKFEIKILNTDNDVGYEILWGNSPEKLYHSCTLYKGTGAKFTNETIGALVKGKQYYIRVDSFNESGITTGKSEKLR